MVETKKVNIKEAAKQLDVHPSTVTRWINDGIIPPDKVEQFGVKVTRIDIDALKKVRQSGRNE